jgi:ribulose-5-phosphate 4-epimerase/fuculose-1-phosphate aldolase
MKGSVMPLESIERGIETDLAAVQWQARVDLAAAHRLAVMHGFHEGIFNHLTLRVPGRNDRYYQIPFGLHWSEVTASCFMEVGFDGTLLAGQGDIERSCYCIHAPMHRLLPGAAAVFHTHMPYGSALARLEDPRILPIGQTELGIMMVTAYDNTYTGLAFDPAEGERLAGVIGDKKVLMMASHGIATVGMSVAEAFDLLYYTERVAQVQLLAMSSGRQLKFLPEDVIQTTIASYRNGEKYGGRSPSDWHFAALKRILDRREPDYKD